MLKKFSSPFDFLKKKKREDDWSFPGKKRYKSSVSPSSSVSLCFLSVAPCSCPYLPLGKSSVCAGEEVFIITCCLGSWIEFLHLCPHSLSLGLLSDTLYLLSFTSLTLSTGNTSTYLSPPLPPLPPLPPPPPLHHRWALLLLLHFARALYRSCPFSEMANTISRNVLLLLRDCVIILCFPLLYSLLVFIFPSSHPFLLLVTIIPPPPPVTVILTALHAAPSSQSIRPKSPLVLSPVKFSAFVVTQIGFFWPCPGQRWARETERRRGSDATHPAAMWWLKDFLFGYNPSPHRCPACIISSSGHDWAHTGEQVAADLYL